MQRVLTGFATIWIVVGAGWLLAQLRIINEAAQEVLVRVAFYAAMPCLLFVTLSQADLQRIFSTNVIVSILAIAVAVLVYSAIAGLLLHRPAGRLVIGAFGASYVNANNMGLPIAAYVLGDTSWVAPILLIQVVFLQPAGLSILDVLHARQNGNRASWARNLTLPFRNPMTVGTLGGLVINLLGWRLPELIVNPIALLGGMAVPAMLVAFGASLRLGPMPVVSGAGETLLISAIKLLVQPLAALLLARFAFRLDLAATLAVTVMAGLPAAQNVFMFATRYRESVQLARDVVLITTISSIFTLMGWAGLVHTL